MSAASRAHVLRWSAWAPGLEDPAAWQAWAARPRRSRGEGHPDAAFLPAMLRRRCTPLTRIALSAAFGALAEEERPRVRTVFASRHGSINESIELLHSVVQQERLSPTKFSHTVHNAQAGLFCIAAGNRQASSSLAARHDTFACGWLEALTHLEREPARPVLLVMSDVALDPTFAALVRRGARQLRPRSPARARGRRPRASTSTSPAAPSPARSRGPTRSSSCASCWRASRASSSAASAGRARRSAANRLPAILATRRNTSDVLTPPKAKFWLTARSTSRGRGPRIT